MGEFQPEDCRLCPKVQSITYRMSAAKWDMKTEIHFQEVRNFPSFDATYCQCCTDLPYIMTTSSWIYKYPNTSLISDQMWRLKVSFIVYKHTISPLYILIVYRLVETTFFRFHSTLMLGGDEKRPRWISLRDILLLFCPRLPVVALFLF